MKFTSCKPVTQEEKEEGDDEDDAETTYVGRIWNKG